jgi:predicted metal-dependent hydrolase
MSRTGGYKPEPVGNFLINLDGHQLQYALKRSHRARYIRLAVHRDAGLIVTVPWRYNAGNLSRLLEKKSKWIIEKCRQYLNVASPPPKKEFITGDSIPYLGKMLKLIIQSNFDGVNTAKRKQNTLTIAVNSNRNDVNTALESWYRMEAREIIGKKTAELSERMGVHFNKLGIRGQRTRWGSCSRKGSLSFNWKLIMAPDAVINYVIVHELAHLKEMNHSNKFWGVVAEYCPRFRQHRKWLKEHDAELNTVLTV